MMAKIEALHKQTGQWIELAEWDHLKKAEFDAYGWIDTYGHLLGTVTPIELPVPGTFMPAHFSALRGFQ
jgi:hypothetical protein